MLFQIIFSLLFILPLFGSLGVVIKGMNSELNKRNAEDQKVSTLKVIGYSIFSIIGVYIALFLIWLIWIPNFELPNLLKLFSYCLAAPYLLGVIGISFALKKVTEFGGSPAKITKSVSDGISES